MISTQTLLHHLYPDVAARQEFERLQKTIETYRERLSHHAEPAVVCPLLPFDQQTSILITYADQIQHPPVLPMKTLDEFCRRHLRGVVSAIHMLPFFPYSSDDGFSVIDYRSVDPRLGNWRDISRLGKDFELMFDMVLNHISAQSQWFQAFLQGDPRYANFFIVVEEDLDLQNVVRPRTSPLLTGFTAQSGEKRLWTTFSADQVDLNYQNPDLLLEMIDLLLFYVSQGAQFIRLDAIAYLWKDPRTSCIHQPQVHWIIQLLRQILEQVAPWVRLVTETNVQHQDNVAYFGDGKNEAHMVYNFALPPLVMHTLQTGNSSALSNWARSLVTPSPQTAFFNFLASHDGIGLNPVRGILSPEEIDALVECTLERGGLVSYKDNPDGSQSPYELNINYLDALSKAGSPEEEPLALQIQRFIAAHAIMFSLAGVPGIYFHSLFGSQGWKEGVQTTGRKRTINRQKLNQRQLERELATPDSPRARIFNALADLLRQRARQPAFDPRSGQIVLDGGEKLFALLRTPSEGRPPVLYIQNVIAENIHTRIELPERLVLTGLLLQDLISGVRYVTIEKYLDLYLRPYQSLWLISPEITERKDSKSIEHL
jgi:glycosidase